MIPQEKKLLDVLSNNDVTFFIPPYQRNYEWTDEQCKVFYDDILKTHDRNVAGDTTEHFFGSITFFQDETPFGQPDKLVLIDGQQRITTTMLFLVALRDILDDNTLREFINNKYLKNNNVSGDNDEYKIKLKQVETDWSAYKHIILGEELEGTEKTSAVYHNYQFFYNQLNLYKANGNNVGSLIDKGLDKFSVITIELQPAKNEWENPQEIFESMNSLGKPLTLADLVRNYLLLGLDANTQENLYKNYWLHIEKVLPGHISDYIRDFMQMKQKTSFKKATENNYKELYGLFKNVFSDLKSDTVLKELYDYSEVYSYIMNGKDTGCKGINDQLKDLGILRVTTAYSFLLSLLSEWKMGKFTDDEMIDILEALKVYFLRRRILKITTAENKVFPGLVNRVGDLENAKDKKLKMFEILADQESNMRLPNDVEMSRYIESMNFYNFQYCKFYLALVEESLTRSRPDLNDELLQIEHIMPQKLNDDWKTELGPDFEEIHQELVNTIGNLTLIRHNQQLGNRSFKEKKSVYKNNAGLQIAKTEITNQTEWNKNTILERTQWIIDYMLKNVMPIPQKMRKTNNFSIKEKKGLSFNELQLIGEYIDFCDDPSIKAKVVNDHEVEFEGKKWRLSPLTREIQTRRDKVSKSGSYSGAQYWEYDGMRLADII